MHPHEIGRENPSKDKHIDCTKNETAKANPGKTGQSFKDGVMKLYSGC